MPVSTDPLVMWETLSNEVWRMIIEELYKNGPVALLSLSRVSHRFHKACKPLILRELVIGMDAVMTPFQYLLENLSKDLGLYTLLIDIRSPILEEAWEPVIEKLLESCTRLEDLKLVDLSGLPNYIEGFFNSRSGQVNFHLSALYGHNAMLPYDLDDPGLTQALKSLDLVVEPATVEDVAEDLRILTGALVKCKNLDSIKLAKTQDDDSPLENFFLSEANSRFVPVRMLSLEDYAWPPKHALRHDFWTFSKIEKLSLVRVPMLNFLSNSTFMSEGLSTLRELTIEPTDEDCRADLARITALEALWGQANKLEVLTIPKYWHRVCPLHEMQNLGQHLLKLDLLDYLNDEGDSWIFPQHEVVMPELALRRIRESLPRLLEFNFGYILSGKNPKQEVLISELSKWESLTDIRVESENHLGFDGQGWPWQNVPSETSSFKAAKKIIQSIVDGKKGSRIRRLVLITCGQYSLGGEAYFRKYEYNRGKLGYEQYCGKPQKFDNMELKYSLDETDPIENGSLEKRVFPIAAV